MPDRSISHDAKARRGRTSLAKALLFAIAVLPILFTAMMINNNGVNVPYGDEWAIIPMIEKWATGQLRFADVFQQHNEHRIVLPKLVFLACAQFTHWNLRAEMFCSLAIVAATSALLFLLMRRTLPLQAETCVALWALTNLYLFSADQAENWLWGFQLQFFIATFLLVAGLACATSSLPIALRLGGTLCAAILGTFSFGNGLLFWPVLLFVFITRGEKRWTWLVWVVAAAIITPLYFLGYKGHAMPKPLYGWTDYPLYFFCFIGGSVVRLGRNFTTEIATFCGVAMLAAFLAGSYYCLRRREQRFAAAPWLALGLYAIGSAVISTLARIDGGAEQALTSRYTTISNNLLFSLTAMAVLAFSSSDMANRGWRFNRPTVAAAAVAILVALFAASIPSELDYVQRLRRTLVVGKDALLFSRVLPVDPMLRQALIINEKPATVQHDIAALDAAGLLNPPPRATLQLRDGEDRPSRTTKEYGELETINTVGPATYRARGWSFLPAEGEPAACVVIARRDRDDWIAVALSNVREWRSDLAVRNRDRMFAMRGWSIDFGRSQLPPGPQEISVWAVDGNRGVTYRLPGVFRVTE
jgi:hypothetical protein